MSVQTFADHTVRYGSTDSGLADRSSRRPVIAPSGALSTSGTSSHETTKLWEAFIYDVNVTESGRAQELQETPDPGADETRRAVAELRRLSGLTWEQLGHIFGVSRRSVHFWASGKPMSAANQTHLMHVLDVIRRAYRGSANETRAALLQVVEGTAPMDLLAAQRFHEAREALGPGVIKKRLELTPLSKEARAARAPLSPEELVEAKHDTVHRERGGARAARTVRKKGRGPS